MVVRPVLAYLMLLNRFSVAPSFRAVAAVAMMAAVTVVTVMMTVVAAVATYARRADRRSIQAQRRWRDGACTLVG